MTTTSSGATLRRGVLVTLVALALCATQLGYAHAVTWKVGQVSMNTQGARDVEVSGARIVWSGVDYHFGTDYVYDQIFTQKLGVDKGPRQVTSGSRVNRFPDVSGSRIAWASGYRYLDYESEEEGGPGWFWDARFDRTYTQKWGTDDNPKMLANGYAYEVSVSGARVLWSGSDANLYTQQIGVDPTPFKVGGFTWDRAISQNRVVWLTNDGVFTRDLAPYSAPVQLWMGDGAEDLGVSGDRVVWVEYHYVGDGVVSRLWTMKVGTDPSPQLIVDWADGWMDARVSGDRVVWSANKGHVYTQEIGVDGVPLHLTPEVGVGNTDYCTDPRVSDDRVVWRRVMPASGRIEIFVRDLGVDAVARELTTGLKNNEYPEVSGDLVAWIGTSDKGSQVYAAGDSSLFAGSYAYVTAPGAPATMYVNKTRTLSGVLKPRHTAGTYPVRIYKYKKMSSGSWKSYGYVKAKVSDWERYSKYSKSITFSSTGSWKLRAYAPADSKHAAVWSSTRYITVKDVTVGTPNAPETMHDDTFYAVRGSLKPRHRAGTKPVRIYKWKRLSNGTWDKRGYTTATVYDYSTYSRYKALMSFSSPGRWRVRAYHPADDDHRARWSSTYDYVVVTN